MPKNYDTKKWICPHCDSTKTTHSGKEAAPFCDECIKTGEVREMEEYDD